MLQTIVQGSCNGDMKLTNGTIGGGCSLTPGGGTACSTTSGAGGTVHVPHRIHSIMQQYFSLVNYIQQCHDLWEQAECQMQEFRGTVFSV